MFLGCRKQVACNLEEHNMGGSKKKSSGGGGGGGGGGSVSNDWQAQQAAQQAQMQAQMEKARQAAEAAEKERIRQQNIQAENQKAADIRRQSESKLQSDFNSAAQNQLNLSQQSTQSAAPSVAGSGYNVGSAQQQKIAGAGGMGSSMQMGIPAALAQNAGVGGTQQQNNQFSLPSSQGLQFGGM